MRVYDTDRYVFCPDYRDSLHQLSRTTEELIQGTTPKPDIFGDMLVASVDALSKLEKEKPMRIPEYPQSEVEIEQEKEGFGYTRWWRAVDAEGKLLMETSNRNDFETYGVLDQDGASIQRLYEKVERRWVDERPLPELSAQKDTDDAH